MCGITGGFWLKEPDELNGMVMSSLNKIEHRGPDDLGKEIFKLRDSALFLGQTRLSIIDLSSAGHQPMFSQDRQYCVVFNGEIYNYKELRDELKVLGYSFYTETDTEVLINSYIEWKENCLTKFIGMFAFTLYDIKSNKLFCARDAFGIKPFFYDNSDGNFLFSSEINGLISLRNKKSKLNYQKSYDYLVTSAYDNSEETFIQDIKHLKPGSYFNYCLKENKIINYNQWWNPLASKETKIEYKDAVKIVREQFLESVKLHLRSDVKIGAALSGGIDSSAIVCAMRYLEPDIEINTFSYIADKASLDESKWIDQVNEFVKAVPHKTYTNQEALTKEIDDLIRLQGEPFGSTSIYAQYKVFELAKQNGVTVTLEGQGADELLAGYIGYPGHRIMSLVERKKYIKAFKFLFKWSKWPGRSKKMGLKYFTSIYFSTTLYDSLRLVTQKNTPKWINENELIKRNVSLKLKRANLNKDAKGRRVIEKMIYALQTYGIPHLLRHGDRNSMNFQIEGRVPFLNTKFADFVLTLPEAYLISNEGETKHIFRDAMRGIVPDNILDRKDKIGFATPEKDWVILISKNVREWLDFSENIPFLNKVELIKEFDAIINGEKKYSWLVWRWINFVRWYQIMEISE